MKRNRSGDAVFMVHRWGPNALSCQTCRQKKRRCDRMQPCSNCKLRNVSCQYADLDEETTRRGIAVSCRPPVEPSEPTPRMLFASSLRRSRHSAPVTLEPREVLYRLERLENAALSTSRLVSMFPATSPSVSDGNSTQPAGYRGFSATPFGFVGQSVSTLTDDESRRTAYTAEIATKLPPVEQAIELFDCFAATCAPTWGVLHIPSTRVLVGQIYNSLSQTQEPDIANLLLLFAMFAGAAFSGTRSMLEKLCSTPAESKAAFKAYLHIALSILDNEHRPITPCTTALAAISCLGHLTTNARGLSDSAVMLRLRCYVMARSLNIHRLDTPKNRKERDLKGCNMIELEVQRRIWWNMVGFDWLNAFSGGPGDGAYLFQPRFMNVNQPKNCDDHLITPTQAEHDFPLSVPTMMTSFIYRLKVAELCREVVDAIPTSFSDPEEVDYDIILAMDKKFQTFIDELPVFLSLEQSSIDQCIELCKERPTVAMQRLWVNMSIQTRLCRLHRPFYLEESTNARYSYSHTACIRAAQIVVDLRRKLDDIRGQMDVNPAQSWIVMQHVSIAGLILAMDVSFNPSAPGAEARKAKVLATCEILEKSTEESGAVMEGVQRNMQTLLSTLNKQKFQIQDSLSQQHTKASDRNPLPSGPINTPRSGTFSIDGAQSEGIPTTGARKELLDETPAFSNDYQSSNPLSLEMDQEFSDQLWADFLAVAPDLDAPQWDTFFDTIEPDSQII